MSDERSEGDGPALIDVRDCPRCGKDHPGQPFAPLLNPEGGYNLFTVCPATSQPVLRQSAPHDPAAAAPLVMEVHDCHRCGGHHPRLEFHRLKRPSSDFHLWALCPETREPVIAKVGGGAHGHHRPMRARPIHPDAGAELKISGPVRGLQLPPGEAPAQGPEGGEGAG